MPDTRLALPSRASSTGVIAVLRADAADQYHEVCAALVSAGVSSIELTLTTPGTLEVLPELSRALGEDVELGVGTVLTQKDAATAIQNGAKYLVTPNVNLDVINLGVEMNTPVLAGAFSPTEAAAAWSAGASAVKLFPAVILGPAYIGHLRGPFPGLEAIPSGGVSLDGIGEWIAAGARAVSLGGPLLGRAFTDHDMGALKARASSALERVQAARAQL